MHIIRVDVTFLIGGESSSVWDSCQGISRHRAVFLKLTGAIFRRGCWSADLERDFLGRVAT